MTFVPGPPVISAPDPPPPSPYPPPPLTPYPPPLTPYPLQRAELDAWTLARRRANLDAGARQRLSRRGKVVATLLLIVFMVGGCGAIAWISFGRYLLLANDIIAGSGGEITYVNIDTGSGRARVDVVLAREVSDREATDVTCKLVLPALSHAGLGSAAVLVYRYDMVFLGRGADACPGSGPSS
jgi:hypothetical protein